MKKIVILLSVLIGLSFSISRTTFYADDYMEARNYVTANYLYGDGSHIRNLTLSTNIGTLLTSTVSNESLVSTNTLKVVSTSSFGGLSNHTAGVSTNTLVVNSTSRFIGLPTFLGGVSTNAFILNTGTAAVTPVQPTADFAVTVNIGGEYYHLLLRKR